MYHKLFPQISEKFNTKGALWGSIVSILVVSVIAIGAQIHIYEGNLRYETLPFNIEQCDSDSRLHDVTWVEIIFELQSTFRWERRIEFILGKQTALFTFKTPVSITRQFTGFFASTTCITGTNHSSDNDKCSMISRGGKKSIDSPIRQNYSNEFVCSFI